MALPAGGQGGSVCPFAVKNMPNIGKKDQNKNKMNKIEKNRKNLDEKVKNQEIYFTLLLRTERAGYGTGYKRGGGFEGKSPSILSRNPFVCRSRMYRS